LRGARRRGNPRKSIIWIASLMLAMTQGFENHMKNFFEEYHKLLYNCNKPYQYVGGEFLSFNKNFDEAKIRFLFAFPDKYEIGISNLGQRILYGLVNDNPDFMADRVYAPEADFKKALIKTKKELYSLEAKIPMKNFDIIGFSLQYELSYPTVLAMLKMGKINIKSNQRSQDEPIIVAGGPCAYNPLPLADFVDAFLIGDGEDLILEVCEVLQRGKAQGLCRAEKIAKLAQLEGVFVPQLYFGKTPHPNPLPQGERGMNKSSNHLPQKIKKRIVQINYENALKTYPIPFSSCVHDRAIVEIRRGCGRMCRFCQPGHVNLPVRERKAQDIIKIAKELVKNTGYDEYSLLSLSSNDYSNIKEVIKELCVDFNEKKISVSLPSQRIDGFNLELANLVQSVRKSTMTLAPEAGSQRLRDVIRKNITEEQILNAALTLYENGWSKIKFYFIVGLPTETYQDLDEMAALLEKIKDRAKLLKKEKELKHSLDITCTLSIFVPKPFTPFQWAQQPSLDEISSRIYYLKDKTKHIKGLKINYHDKFTSQIEAVLTRGDKKLCAYIEELFKAGCYLDAWGEYFDKNIWLECAKKVEISLDELSQKEYELNQDLPWDFIDIGVEKDWLINEYKDALKSKTNPSCQTNCVNCGVCNNFKVKKVMDKKYNAKIPQQAQDNKINCSTFQLFDFSTKYRIKLTKSGILRYFSHLDWQNTFHKALSRSGLKVAYSQGFNPTMKVSLGVALPLFIESGCELVDIELLDDVCKEEVKLKLEKVLPEGCKIKSIVKIDKSAQAIDNTVQWAQYEIKPFDNTLQNFESLRYNMDRVLSSEEILLTKKNKKGLTKTTNIKSAIKSYEFIDDCLFIVLKTGQGTDVPALRADDLMKIIAPDILFDIKRVKFFDRDMNEI